MLALLAEVNPLQTLPEEELLSTDSSIGGTADLLLIREADLIVVDYKTGIVSDDIGMPKAGYERQIRIYAGLAEERFGVPASRGILMSMREGLIEVSVAPGSVATALAAARDARENYNERVPGPQPATPSEINCAWCPHKARCDGFWSALTEDWVGTMGQCLSVVVTRSPEVAANGLGAFAAKVFAGTLQAGDEVIVVEVPEQVLGNLDIGKPVSVTGLRITQRNAVLRWSPLSSLAHS